MAKLRALHRQAAGLHSQFSRHTLPEGALIDATNCVIDRPGVISKRRGFARYGDALTGDIRAFMDFKDRLILLDGQTLKYDSDGAGTWGSWVGTYVTPASDRRLRGLQVRSNLYFLTSEGVYKNDALANDPILAGVPGVKHIDTVITASAADGGWLQAGEYVAYRAVLRRDDANAFQSLGAPSHPSIVRHKGLFTNEKPQFYVTLPHDAREGDRLLIYRTLEAASVAAVGDQHFFVFEVYVTAADIAAKIITITDDIDPAFLGRELYTNATVEGLEQENSRPPYAKDMATFKGHTFYANTRQRHSVTVRLAYLDTVLAGDDFIVEVNSVQYPYEADGSGGEEDGIFQKITSLPTTSENIEATCYDLISHINRRTPSPPFYAEYVSGPDDPPGFVRITLKGFDETPITLRGSSTSMEYSWDPPLDTVNGRDLAVSTNDIYPNRLYRSKLEEPDAVPFLNFDPVGSEESPILRILALRDSLIILKEEGAWRLSGEAESDFVIKELDPSVRLKVPDTAVVLNNAVYAYTNLGVCRIDESGTRIVSWPIEETLERLERFSNFETTTYAVAYEREKLYLLWVPELEGDDHAGLCYVYNYLNDSWSGPWRKKTRAGLVLFDTEDLFLAHADDSRVLKLRNTGLDNDYQDESIDVTATAKGTTTDSDGATVATVDVTYAYTGATLEAGWLFVDGATEDWVTAVTALGGTSYRLQLQTNPALSAVPFAATLEIPVKTRIEWAPETLKDPSSLKQFVEAAVFFEEDGALRHTLGFKTNLSPAELFVSDFAVSAAAGWGTEPWGNFPWGGSPLRATPARSYVPRGYQIASELSVIYRSLRAREWHDVLGMSVIARPFSERVSR